MIVDKEFDLDVTFEQQADEKLIASLSPEQLSKHIQNLPADLVAAATGVLIEHKTYSDVSQAAWHQAAGARQSRSSRKATY
jgi:hypothetical protein